MFYNLLFGLFWLLVWLAKVGVGNIWGFSSMPSPLGRQSGILFCSINCFLTSHGTTLHKPIHIALTASHEYSEGDVTAVAYFSVLTGAVAWISLLVAVCCQA